MAWPMIAAGALSVGSSLLDMFGGGGGGANDAANIQAEYGAGAYEDFKRMFGLSQNVLSPYNQGGMYALEQLIGTGAMQKPTTPGVQAQVEGWNAWQSGDIDVKNAPGWTGEPRKGWQTWDDKERFIAKNRKELEAMLPTGMRVKDVPHWQRWITNPYPIDQWGNPLDESLWKYPQEQGEGGNAMTAGLLNNPPPAFGETLSEYRDSPWYTQQLNEGVKALESSAAGSGMLQSGNFGKSLMGYGQDYAFGKAMDVHQQGVNDWLSTRLNPMMAMTGMGQVAGQNMSSNAMTAGLTQAQLKQYQGEALASGYLGQAAASQNSMGGLSGMMGMGAGMLSSFGGGGGGSSSGGSSPLVGNSIGGGSSNDYGLGKYKTW